jgi:flagellar FliL protein
MSADKKEEHKEEKKEGGAEGAPAEGAVEGEGGGKKSKKKLIIFAVLGLVILLGGAGAAAYFLGFLGGHDDKLACENVKEGDEHYDACAEELAKAASGATPGVFIEIPDMIVNLNSPAKQPRFLKISLKVELEKVEDQKTFETVLPRVVDQFQTYLRELRVEDLRGSSGMYRMKIELINRVRAAAPSIKVSDVLFQEILIQ